ncbi:UNKNOWN [Stylonychia lemnae]|uniref:Transmembrane protein n=1 Tax=Stylonychia lemnae TaxID=5949 RepID=A0A078AMK6_STYLE|nr:UNKNOWN [Stylonychia lemnae]|eukprot:CDW82103.1 UNKNOWN [Stylonychia lemnae]
MKKLRYSISIAVLLLFGYISAQNFEMPLSMSEVFENKVDSPAKQEVAQNQQTSHNIENENESEESTDHKQFQQVLEGSNDQEILSLKLIYKGDSKSSSAFRNNSSKIYKKLSNAKYSSSYYAQQPIFESTQSQFYISSENDIETNQTESTISQNQAQLNSTIEEIENSYDLESVGTSSENTTIEEANIHDHDNLSTLSLIKIKPKPMKPRPKQPPIKNEDERLKRQKFEAISGKQTTVLVDQSNYSSQDGVYSEKIVGIVLATFAGLALCYVLHFCFKNEGNSLVKSTFEIFPFYKVGVKQSFLMMRLLPKSSSTHEIQWTEKYIQNQSSQDAIQQELGFQKI